MSAPTQPTTRPRPSSSLLRRRHRRATANLLVRGVGPVGGSLPRSDGRERTRRFLTMGEQLLPAPGGHSYHDTGSSLPGPLPFPPTRACRVWTAVPKYPDLAGNSHGGGGGVR